MKVLHSFIIIFLTVSLTLGPAEGGLFNWVVTKVSHTVPWHKKANQETSKPTNNNGNGKVGTAGAQMNTGGSPNQGTSKPPNNNGKGKVNNAEAQIKTGGTQNNVGNVKSFGVGFGSANGNMMWSGDVYWMNQRQYYANQQCIEELSLFWNNGEDMQKNSKKTGKIFKPKCLKDGSLRTVIHNKALLIVAKPTDDFCVFSSRKNEYYYKENLKWKKGNINDDKTEEVEMSAPDVATLTQRIFEWMKMINKFNSNINNIAGEKKQENQRHSQETQRISDKMEVEAKNHKKNQDDIGKLRTEEYAKQVQERGEYDAMFNNQESEANLQKKYNEMTTRAQQAENELRAKEAAEQSRYLMVDQDLKNQLIQENARHSQEHQNILQKNTEEINRFNQEYQDLINKGY